MKIMNLKLIPRLSLGLSCLATIMPDEFFNIYDETGPGMSNYKP